MSNLKNMSAYPEKNLERFALEDEKKSGQGTLRGVNDF